MSCTPSTLFSNLQDDESVTIILSQYGLTNVPKEISSLKNARTLTILKNENAWATYPPKSAWSKMADSPPFETLPDEIAALSQLEELNIPGLNLKNLPDNFYQLENLQSLNLSMNKLDITKEISKLKQLKKLTNLTIYGNKLDTTQIQTWSRSSPDLNIEYFAN